VCGCFRPVYLEPNRLFGFGVYGVVRLVCEEVERLGEFVEERLIGLDVSLVDEVKVVDEYMRAKERGSVEVIPLEDVKKEP
jgi:hypothetical protein